MSKPVCVCACLYAFMWCSVLGCPVLSVQLLRLPPKQRFKHVTGAGHQPGGSEGGGGGVSWDSGIRGFGYASVQTGISALVKRSAEVPQGPVERTLVCVAPL